MNTTRLKLVTIIADRLLSDDIANEIRDLGARGYTISDAHGQGSRGLQPLDWEGANVRIESIVSEQAAERIIAHLTEKYFKHHGLIAFLQDVEVLRGDRFV